MGLVDSPYNDIVQPGGRRPRMLASAWFGSFGFDEVFFVFGGVAYNAVVRKNE